MSLNTTVRLISIAVIALVLYKGYQYYDASRKPAYVPPATREEVTLTVIPGWNLRQVAEYLVEKGFASSSADVFEVTGLPAYEYARNKPDSWPPYPLTAVAFKPTTSSEKITDLEMHKPEHVSYEGYLAPESIRVFADAPLDQVLAKFIFERDKEFKQEHFEQAVEALETTVYKDAGLLDQPNEWHEVLTMASIIEKETRHDEDRAIVADILWRRFQKNWALQVDSSVHYISARTGDVFTTEQERAIDSPWNTYKYPGLPPGPICNPSIESIKAALHPEKNTYWYFLTGRDGKMYYARTLDEHAANKRHL